MGGTVSFKAAGGDEWVAAVLNRPLTSGDELWVADNSRAELDLGHAFIRLDGRTGVGILSLDDNLVQIKISEGTAQVKLQRLDEDDEFEVDTPQTALTLLRTGDYRIQVSADGRSAQAAVRSGQIEASTSTQTFSIRSNQKADLTETANAEATYNVTTAPPLDAFDTFCQARDERPAHSESEAYVSPYVIGREDLDVYGTWRMYPEYGPVWIPRTMPPGWAPYRFGHWVWIQPWGWTWVDDAPWGFAPFHYGRWVIVNTVWVWVPGPIRYRAVYAPALVIFVGGGGGLRYHVRVGLGVGIAWFPLGPREIYLPPYRASRGYVTNLNVSHTTVISTATIWRTDLARQHYVNLSATGGVTSVAEEVFVGARPVGSAATRLTGPEIRELRVSGTAAPVAPSRASLARRASDAPLAPRPSESVEQRRVTVLRSPAAPSVPLERQRPALDRNPGRPASRPDRPQFSRMLKEAAQGEFQLLIFWALDRFSREGTLANSKTPRASRTLRGFWKSLTEPWIDSAGPFRDVVISLLASLANQEKLRISERVRAGLERARAGGTKTGRPIGRPRVVLNKDRVVELRGGMSWRQIAQKLGTSATSVRRVYEVPAAR